MDYYDVAPRPAASRRGPDGPCSVGGRCGRGSGTVPIGRSARRLLFPTIERLMLRYFVRRRAAVSQRPARGRSPVRPPRHGAWSSLPVCVPSHGLKITRTRVLYSISRAPGGACETLSAKPSVVNSNNCPQLCYHRHHIDACKKTSSASFEHGTRSTFIRPWRGEHLA